MQVEVSNIFVRKSNLKILDDITLNISGSKTVGIVGPSGSGKTTLIRALVGSQRIESGNISISGMKPGDKHLRSRLGYMAQKYAFYSDLTVEENLKYFAAIVGCEKKRIFEVLDLTEMSKRSKSLASTLSGGESSRLSLGIALLGNPEILLLDEPTVGLDPLLRIELWRLFSELASTGKLLLISSHIMEEAERCDEVLLLRDGKLLFFGKPQELKRKTDSDDIEESFIKLVGTKKS